MYRSIDCMEKFIEQIKDNVTCLYATFPQQLMTAHTNVLKREHKAEEKYHICLKEFSDPENRKIRDHCYYTCFYRGAAYNKFNLKY